MLKSNMTYIKIAGIGGIATAVMGYMARGKIQDNVKSATFYKEAMKLVRAHPAAVHLLGEPIKDGRIDVGNNRKNFIEGNRAQFEVPLKGPKQKGTMYILATKEDDDKEWSVNQLELETVNNLNKRLIVKRTSNT